ncbi:hypothetical protein D0B97_09340 [Vibrio cholerae]|nr:hypothetical protein [Vibrio cholerae]
MKATAKSFFGTNLEQEVLDEIVILPVAIRNTGTGTIRLPVNMEWKDFEYIEIALGIATNVQVYDMSTISGAFLKSNPSAWSVRLQLNDGTSYGLVVSASGANTASWSSFGASNYPRYMIGYKRRISRVGIDELMSAMSLPNLIANADLTDNPINQRNFNGNWSALAVGAYGYDQWMKVSSTHMGAVIEAGKYRPNTKHTLTKDDVVIGEFMSPASGHWTVAVPFATSGKFDLYAGQFKRPWHPVLDGLERCQSHYSDLVGRTPFWNAHEGNYTVKFACREFPVTMRKSPNCQAFISGSGGASINSVQATVNDVNVTLTSAAAQSTPSLTRVVSDASITLAELNGQIITV